MKGNGDANGTIRSEWNFDDTIRGTIKGMPVNLNLDDMDDEDEEDEQWDLEDEEVSIWDGTTRIREGTVVDGPMASHHVSC